MSGIIATILCFALLKLCLHCWPKCFHIRVQNRAFPVLCKKAGFLYIYIYTFFLFPLWTKVICTVIFSLWNLQFSLPPNPREWLYHSSVMHLFLIYLNGPLPSSQILIPWPLRIIWPSHFWYLLCTLGNKSWWLWLAGSHSITFSCIKTFWMEKLGPLYQNCLMLICVGRKRKGSWKIFLLLLLSLNWHSQYISTASSIIYQMSSSGFPTSIFL